MHHWAISNRVEYSIDNEQIWIAPPEYIILRKLQYYQEGGATKHIDDIKNILDISGAKLDLTILREKVKYLHLEKEWNLVADN